MMLTTDQHIAPKIQKLLNSASGEGLVPIAVPPSYGGLRNEFATAPLGQQLAYRQSPYGSFVFVEPKEVPSGFYEICLSRTGSGVTIDAATLASPQYTSYVTDGSLRQLCGKQDRLSESLAQWVPTGYVAAKFDVIWLDNSPAAASNIEDQIASTEQINDATLRFQQVRAQLQDWLGASVDELAELLDLSPTTIVNLTKPGRNIRPKTVRKMMAVYGLLSEFQRVVGMESALAWARTTGRRLLADGRLSDFEQFLSTRIFPIPHRAFMGAAKFGDNDAELVTKPGPAVGRPSRI